MPNKKLLLADQQKTLLELLNKRFNNNMNRHKDMLWNQVKTKLEANPEKLWSLNEMEKTGGKPDVIEYNPTTNQYTFYDCSQESPNGRRSLCYDQEALNTRKEHKPKNSVINMAINMGVELLTEHHYRRLQKFGKFDTKTSSWIKTPEEIRNLGGAIFADYRYGTVFIYHNGAASYYAARGFRGFLTI